MLWMVTWATAATPETPKLEQSIGKLGWQTDYAPAYREAQKDKKQLLLFFHDGKNPSVQFEQKVLTDAELTPVLKKFVRVMLPIDAVAPADWDKENAGKKLMDLPAFVEMEHLPGVAIIDLVDKNDSYYGRVVSAHTLTDAEWIPAPLCKLILELPRGSITQRAITYVVRTHPSQPQSAWGHAHPFLMHQAHLHSQLMVQYGGVGHHDWGTRSAEVAAQLGSSPQEVAASAGSERVLPAAREAVNMWSGSGVHWGMVSSPQNQFGYDMVRSPGGGWFATGIFVY